MPAPSPDNPDLSTHPLVEKALEDSDTLLGLVALTGYFGPTSKAGSIRLYPSLDFQSYFEIPTRAIVATNPMDANNDQSPTVVYVKAGTAVEAVQTSTQPVESYLQGGITGGYIQAATAGAYGGGIVPEISICGICNSHAKVHGRPEFAHAPWGGPHSHHCLFASKCPQVCQSKPSP